MSLGWKLTFAFLFFSMFNIWYLETFSTNRISEYEAGTKESEQRVLIGGQGSEFKDALRYKLVRDLVFQGAFIKVVDLGNIHDYNPKNWSAVVLIHSWEMWQPHIDARRYLRDHKNASNIVVLTSSGSSEEAIDEVDGTSAASSLSDVDPIAANIIEKINSI